MRKFSSSKQIPDQGTALQLFRLQLTRTFCRPKRLNHFFRCRSYAPRSKTRFMQLLHPCTRRVLRRYLTSNEFAPPFSKWRTSFQVQFNLFACLCSPHPVLCSSPSPTSASCSINLLVRTSTVFGYLWRFATLGKPCGISVIAVPGGHHSFH